ncbi:MAG: hypothetical protein ACOC0W_02150 [Desulfosalsimonas sp.]
MRGIDFFIILTAVTVVDLLVPYFITGDIASLGASFLFWSLLAFMVIVFTVIYTGRWGKGL